MANQNVPRPYSAGPAPNDPKELTAYLEVELLKIQMALQGLAQSPSIPPSYREPVKPREGVLALAAGHVVSADHWSPDGSGDRALYQYRMTAPDSYAWVKIG